MITQVRFDLDIKTARSSIGKKVIYTGKDYVLIGHLDSAKYGTISKTIDGDYVGVCNIHGSEMYFKANELEFMEMSDFKIGDKVVLRPETKPYTYKSHNDIKEIPFEVRDEIHTVTAVLDDGDIGIMNNIGSEVAIQARHLKHVLNKPHHSSYESFSCMTDNYAPNIESCSNEELRFMIFHSNPSRTLQEMQDMEKWLLNK